MWSVEFWEDKRGKRPVEERFKDLPKIDKKEVAKLFGLLETFGYELSMPRAKNLGGGLYEFKKHGQ